MDAIKILIFVEKLLPFFGPIFLMIFLVEKLMSRLRHKPSRFSWYTLLFFILLAGSISISLFAATQTMLVHWKWDDAKNDLGAIFTGQVAYHGEHNTYGQTFDQIAWRPFDNNLYSYYLGSDFIPCQREQSRACKGQVLSPIPEPWPWKVRPLVTKNTFVALAVGNIDGDTALDVWMINEKKELIRVFDDRTNNYTQEFLGQGPSIWDVIDKYCRTLPMGGWYLIGMMTFLSSIIFAILFVWRLVRDLNNFRRRKTS